MAHMTDDAYDPSKPTSSSSTTSGTPASTTPAATASSALPAAPTAVTYAPAAAPAPGYPMSPYPYPPYVMPYAPYPPHMHAPQQPHARSTYSAQRHSAFQRATKGRRRPATCKLDVFCLCGDVWCRVV